MLGSSRRFEVVVVREEVRVKMAMMAFDGVMGVVGNARFLSASRSQELRWRRRSVMELDLI